MHRSIWAEYCFGIIVLGLSVSIFSILVVEIGIDISEHYRPLQLKKCLLMNITELDSENYLLELRINNNKDKGNASDTQDYFYLLTKKKDTNNTNRSIIRYYDRLTSNKTIYCHINNQTLKVVALEQPSMDNYYLSIGIYICIILVSLIVIVSCIGLCLLGSYHFSNFPCSICIYKHQNRDIYQLSRHEYAPY
jgi:hypothetical protein